MKSKVDLGGIGIQNTKTDERLLIISPTSYIHIMVHTKVLVIHCLLDHRSLGQELLSPPIYALFPHVFTFNPFSYFFSLMIDK